MTRCNTIFTTVIPIVSSLITIGVFSGVFHAMRLSNNDRTCENKETSDVFNILMITGVFHFVFSVCILFNELRIRYNNRVATESKHDSSGCSSCLLIFFIVFMVIDFIFFIMGITYLQYGLICSKSLVVATKIFCGYFVSICGFFAISLLFVVCCCYDRLK